MVPAGLAPEDLVAIVEQGGVGLCLVEPEGGIRWLNDELGRLLRIPAGAGLVGRSIFEVMPRLIGLREGVDGAIHDGKFLELPVSPVGGPDDRTWLASRVGPIRLGGQIVALIATRAMPARAESYLAAIIDQLPAGVIVAEAPSGRLLFGNQKLTEILHRSFVPSMSVAEYGPAWRLHHPDGRPYGEGEDPLARALLTGAIVKDEEVKTIGDDASERYISASAAPIRDPDGRIVAAILVITDVAERKRTLAEREELIAREQRQSAELQLVLDSLPDGLIIYGPHGEIRQLNPEAQRILELADEHRRLPFAERLQRIHLETIAGKLLTVEQTPMWRALQGQITKGEIFVVWRDGGPKRTVAMSTAPLRDQQHQVIGAVNIMTDVTRVYELQQRVEDLIRTISHDVRVPLSAILLQAQLLERSPDVAPKAARIIRSARSVNAMIESLIEANRAEAGTLTPRPAAIRLRDFGLGLKDRLHGVLNEERIRIAAPNELPALWCDPDHLDRVLTNLVGNGLKYSPPDTEVVVDAHPVDDSIQVLVIDQGPGIPPEQLPHIFERFYRGQAKGAGEGLGLGLFIARALVAANHGQIWVESELGKGSVFHVTLPRAPDTRDEARDVAPP